MREEAEGAAEPPGLHRVDLPPPGMLALTPCPPGGAGLDAALRSLSRAGIDTVVSLLSGPEARRLGVQDEASTCRRLGLRFWNHPIDDHGVPGDTAGFERLVERLVVQLSRGGAVAIHCRAGIGRSGLVASAVLVALGASPAAAIARVTRARGVPAPETEEQRAYLAAFRWRTGRDAAGVSAGSARERTRSPHG